MQINKKFHRGEQLYRICNDGEKKKDLFDLKKGDTILTKLIGCNGNIWGTKQDYRFETLDRPVCTFLNPIDRLAITDAIAYLEDRYKTL